MNTSDAMVTIDGQPARLVEWEYKPEFETAQFNGGREPDPLWSVVDGQGHFHTWSPKGGEKGGYELPTLRERILPCGCSAVDEPHEVPAWFCRVCGQGIEPGTKWSGEITRQFQVGSSFRLVVTDWTPPTLRPQEVSQRQHSVVVRDASPGWKDNSGPGWFGWATVSTGDTVFKRGDLQVMWTLLSSQMWPMAGVREVAP